MPTRECETPSLMQEPLSAGLPALQAKRCSQERLSVAERDIDKASAVEPPPSIVTRAGPSPQALPVPLTTTSGVAYKKAVALANKRAEQARRSEHMSLNMTSALSPMLRSSLQPERVRVPPNLHIEAAKKQKLLRTFAKRQFDQNRTSDEQLRSFRIIQQMQKRRQPSISPEEHTQHESVFQAVAPHLTLSVMSPQAKQSNTSPTFGRSRRRHQQSEAKKFSKS